MFVADFLGDPTGTGLDISQTHPCEWWTDSRKLWAFFGCNSAQGSGRLHRSTKVVGVGRLLHGRGGWAERAADLGWDTLALFGCHPTRPLDHLNGAGLLWRISGGKISSMGTDWATIEINGAQRIIHRRPSPANFLLPWRRRGP
jgi:hypothetical protein